MTDAHEANETIHLRWHYPEHESRADAPGHQAFEATRHRLKAEGLWRCHVQGCARTDIELHHSALEFALLNGASVEKFDQEYGLHLTTAEFADYVNGPEGTTPLCSYHHRGVEGIHLLPEPGWKALLVWLDGIAPPVEVEHGTAAA